MRRTLLIGLAVMCVAGCQTSKPLHVAAKDVRTAYVRQNPQLESPVKRAIRGGRVIPGMSKDDVEASWGEPYLRGGSRWEYRGWRNIYILFSGDRVTSVNFYSNL
ncbi:MAG: hypothetical protein KC900_10905 [Candidatus Omnitrophica bacterium]|nr:hypothetical protein [Candidatus Omnitrophota bacterium]